MWSSLALPVIIRLVIDGLAEETLTRELLWKYLGQFLLKSRLVSLAHILMILRGEGRD